MLDDLTGDRAAAARAHDALWATLWNRRYDDVDEPVWQPDAAYAGMLAFAWRFPEGTGLAGLDLGEAFLVFRGLTELPPIGSRVRVLAGERDRWRLAEAVQALGLELELRFDDPAPAADASWIAPLRTGLERLRQGLEARRVQLETRRGELGARNEPTSVEEIWRREVAAIAERVTLETEFTPEEHAAMARARAKGARTADAEEHRLIALRRRRLSERSSAEVAAFRAERWPALRETALAENARYAEYRAEVLKLEEALQRVRSLHERALKGGAALAAIEEAGLHVRGPRFEPARLAEPGRPEELVRTVELLHAALPQRPPRAAASFSAYRAPTAGPAVTPPRV